MQPQLRQQTITEVAKKFWENYNGAQGWNGVKDLCVEDAVFWSDAYDQKTIQPYVDFASICYNHLNPNTKFECLAVFSNENQVSMHLRQTITNTGTHELATFVKEPTNKSATTEFVFIFSFNQDNKITKLVKIFNQYPMYESIGWPQPIKTPYTNSE